MLYDWPANQSRDSRISEASCSVQPNASKGVHIISSSKGGSYIYVVSLEDVYVFFLSPDLERSCLA